MALVVNKGEGSMAVIEPPSPLFSLNHFTFRDHTHTHYRNACTHSCNERFNMDKWALGRRIQLAHLSLFALWVSLPLRVSQDMPGLNAFQSSPQHTVAFHLKACWQWCPLSPFLHPSHSLHSPSSAISLSLSQSASLSLFLTLVNVPSLCYLNHLPLSINHSNYAFACLGYLY